MRRIKKDTQEIQLNEKRNNGKQTNLKTHIIETKHNPRAHRRENENLRRRRKRRIMGKQLTRFNVGEQV